ncbi:MAG: hypothetical protein IKT90_04035, partial [Clostridia bacterium]|nr:hypothetical protein [Clostridia bacterium]
MNKQNNNRKKKNKGFGFYVIVFLVLLGTVGVLMKNGGFSAGGSSSEVIRDASYSDIQQYFFDEKVEKFEVYGTELTMELKDGTKVEYVLADSNQLREDLGELIESQKQAGILSSYDYQMPETSLFTLILPYLILFGFMLVLYVFVARRQGGGGGAANFGKSRAKLATPGPDSRKVTFADVAGADEEKADLQ